MDLELLKEQIVDFAQKNNMIVFEANIEHKANILTFQQDIDEFLPLAKKANAELLILETSVFEFGKINREGFETYKKYDHKICTLTVGWAKEGILYVFTRTAKWFEELVDESKDLSEDEDLGESTREQCKECGAKFLSFDGDEYCHKCTEKKREEGEKKAEKLAKELANDPRYITCKNPTERKLYIKERYPETIEDEFFSEYHLMSHATALINFRKRKSNGTLR